MKKTLLPLCILLFTVSVFSGCLIKQTGSDFSDSDTKNDGLKDGETMETIVTPITFDNITDIDDLEKFITEVDKEDGTHDNDSKDVGVIVSPYFSATITDKTISCYAVRTAIGAHSFAMIDVTENSFPFQIEITVATGGKTVNVLPESYGVKTELTLKGVKATIEKFGNYTFVVGNDKTKALTLFVRKDEVYVAPEDYDVVRIAAGTHNEKIAFTKSKQVLYFESGTHYIKYNIDFLNDTEVYLERGAYIYATMPDNNETPILNPDWAGMTRWKALFEGNGVENVRISGRGMIDLSKLEWHARSAIRFDLSKNVTVEGVSINNAPEWTMYFTQSQNISVSEIMLFGYRQNSDGICLTDCRNATVKNCFARSGDDLFEVKSMYGACTVPIENIRFEQCNAWPDKARGLGIIAESVRDMTNICFIDCSVGYASAKWMDELGSIVVCLAGKAKIDDVHFENIEIFESAKYPVNVTVDKESSAVIENVYFNNIDIRGKKDIRIANNSEVGGEIKNIWFDGCTRDGNQIKTYNDLSLNLTNVNRKIVKINKKN